MNQLGAVRELFNAIDKAWYALHLSLGEDKDYLSEYVHFKMGKFAAEVEDNLLVLREILEPLATHELIEAQMKDREKYLSETESEQKMTKKEIGDQNEN